MIRQIIALLMILPAAFWAVGCGQANQVDESLAGEMPQKMLWAWERPEDLRFADPKEIGVAFLAQTIFLNGNDVVLRQRRQPLEVAPGAYVVAVTRIETAKGSSQRPALDQEMAAQISSLIVQTTKLPDVKGVQIDFDAVVSERDFYSLLMTRIRSELPPAIKLTMTALASWCTGDAWFNDFPVAEAVPMVFHMGADSDKIRSYLRNGNDWREPLCRGSYGLLMGDRLDAPLAAGRRIYYFKDSAWVPSDIERLR